MAKKKTEKKSVPEKPPVKAAQKKAAAKKAPPQKAATKKAPSQKAAAKKAPSQKTAAKTAAEKTAKKSPKKTTAKTVKKSSAKKAKAAPPTKKTVKKAPVAKKQVKAATKVSKSSKSGAEAKSKKRTKAKKAGPKKVIQKSKVSATKKTAAKSKEKKLRADLIEKIRERREDRTGDDPVTPSRSGPGTFTIEDVRRILRESSGETETPKVASKQPKKTPKKVKAKAQKAEDSGDLPSRPPQTFGAVSMADILGFDPHSNSNERQKQDESSIPKKFLPYYRELLRMRDSISEQIDLHSEESQILSKKSDGGGSAYSQHLADAGTDTFDIDFALSLVSSEQEALNEINDAINRMREGTYGICEITGKPISKQRLKAVPFTRYSVEGQKEVERSKRKTTTRSGGVFGTSAEDVAAFSESDDE